MKKKDVRYMNKIYLMEKIKNIYESGGNIIEYLSTIEGQKKLTL